MRLEPEEAEVKPANNERDDDVAGGGGPADEVDNDEDGNDDAKLESNMTTKRMWNQGDWYDRANTTATATAAAG